MTRSTHRGFGGIDQGTRYMQVDPGARLGIEQGTLIHRSQPREEAESLTCLEDCPVLRQAGDRNARPRRGGGRAHLKICQKAAVRRATGSGNPASTLRRSPRAAAFVRSIFRVLLA